MALQNIGAGNKDDAFYRYKMPKLLTKIEGRGNGIKTNIVNMVDVAKALGRLPSYTTKFFGCELGAQSKFDDKTATSIVNGAHDNAKMVALLEIFIKKYVQCYGCGNPETTIVITKSQAITLKCAACGFVSNVDMRDKLTTFILKNPPEQKKGGKDKKGIRKADKERLNEGESLDEEAKKLKKETRKKKGQDEASKVSKKKASGSDGEEHSPTPSQADEDENVADEDDGVQWQTDTSVQAAQQRIKEQLTSATSEMVMLENQEPDLEFKGKPSKESGNKVATQKTSAKNLEVSKADAGVDTTLKKVKELSLQDRLVEEFKECLKKGFTATELVSYMSKKDLPQQEAMVAYFEALFGDINKGLTKEIVKKKIYLAKVAQDEAAQGYLLKAIENHYLHGPSEAQKEIALVLKLLYDEDILEEEVVFEWHDKIANSGGGSKSLQQVVASAGPFVDWLRNAEAESDEE